MLWAFDITPALGVTMPLDSKKYAPGDMPGTPSLEMPVHLTMRSEEKRKIILQEYELQVSQRSPMVREHSQQRLSYLFLTLIILGFTLKEK
jgi:hypothetical protein